MTHQPRLIAEEPAAYTTDEESKAAYRERLRQKLQDPAFRQIEGFPIGEDEDILALSDPPYYTACPNPFLPEIIAQWQEERAALRQELGLPDDSDNNGTYQREPFAADVSEGKSGAIYNAHTYHTKVPHKAVMRYLLHYTDPGDIVFDGFCGTGMTGVAAQLCGDRNEVESLGYRVDEDGVIYEGAKPISRLGVRKAILNDLSPAATFIAYNYNAPVETDSFVAQADQIIERVRTDIGWMYQTWHPDVDDPNRIKGEIDNVIWSDVFICSHCSMELVFWEVAVDVSSEKILDEFACSNCQAQLNKGSLERVTEVVYQGPSRQIVKRGKQVPVLINYSIGKRRFQKHPDHYDLSVIEQVKRNETYWSPGTRIDKDIDIWYERDYRSLGVYEVNDFYTPRNLLALTMLWSASNSTDGNSGSRRDTGLFRYCVTAVMYNLSKMNRWPRLRGPLAGTLYIPSIYYEINPFETLKRRVYAVKDAVNHAMDSAITGTQSLTDFHNGGNETVDYIFTDPPFGSNIIYSDLSIIWEAWLKLFTNTEYEAVVHRRKKAGHRLADYQELMVAAFASMYSMLKPGRWITVEFHNTKNAVWNAIQEAILRAGFVVADVSTLDKQVGSFKQVTTTSAVKQDLIISAYKPHASFERRFLRQGGTLEGVWGFVRHHLAQLPVVLEKDGILNVVTERQDYLLYDRMVAFHVQRGIRVPLSAPEFYEGLWQRFAKRNGMFFLPEQVPAYDRASLEAERIGQLSLFVNDEKSAIQWLRQQLDPELEGQRQTYQEIQPKFLRQLHQARHEALPELSELLEQNFLQDGANRWYVPDPNKAGDLEKLRQKALLREFKQYVESKGRLRHFRTEAVRAGFAAAYQEGDYQTIIEIGDRLPERVLQEDLNLLMYYDNASLRTTD